MPKNTMIWIYEETIKAVECNVSHGKAVLNLTKKEKKINCALQIGKK